MLLGPWHHDHKLLYNFDSSRCDRIWPLRLLSPRFEAES